MTIIRRTLLASIFEPETKVLLVWDLDLIKKGKKNIAEIEKALKAMTG